MNALTHDPYELALELRRKPACEYILHTLWKGRPRYGMEISQIISQSTEYKMHITPGSIYPSLKFLEKHFLVKLTKVEIDFQVRGTHKRKYYEITQNGKETLVTLDQIRFHLNTLEPGFQ